MRSNPQAPAILLIEKDEVTLEMYQRELCKSFTVFAQTDTAGIPALLASQPIQALIIEPEIDHGQGWELIRSLPTLFPGRSIPVIVCSTRDPFGNGSGSRPEAARYLTKPVLPHTLRELTLELLGSQVVRRNPS
jgi:DNA-binding response OmpR family regulator